MQINLLMSVCFLLIDNLPNIFYIDRNGAAVVADKFNIIGIVKKKSDGTVISIPVSVLILCDLLVRTA